MRPVDFLASSLRQLDPLGLAARQRGRRLAQPDVAQAHLADGLQLLPQLGDVLQEAGRLADRHVQHVGDAGLAVLDLQRLAVVAPPAAGLALDVDVGQKVHLDAQDAVALAGLAAAALHVEGIAPRLVAARLGLGQAGEQIADVGEDAGVGGGVRARRAPDGRLIDVDHLVDVLQPLDARRSRLGGVLGPIQLLLQRAAAGCRPPGSTCPTPTRPVTQVNTPIGKLTLRLRRLWARAPADGR